MAEEIGFTYIKTEGVGGSCEEDVYSALQSRSLEIIFMKDVLMNYIKLREHQPILFDTKGDLNDIWKIQGAARLIGTTVRSMVILGDEAIDKSLEVRQEVRDRYALPCEFARELEMSYPNYIHVADNKPQVEHDIKVLIPEKLDVVREINGIHEITSKVW